MLSKVLRVYFASSRRGDFAGAHDHQDLWVFDEFQEPENKPQEEYYKDPYSVPQVTAATQTSFANTMLRLLDGQQVRLDRKYKQLLVKNKNVPVIIIANRLTHSLRHHGAFRARFIRLSFETPLI